MSFVAPLPHDQELEDAQRDRQRRRALAKARRVRDRNRKRAERQETRRLERRVRELQNEYDTASRDYDRAFKRVVELGRGAFDEREIGAWDEVHELGAKIRAARAERLRVETQLEARTGS